MRKTPLGNVKHWFLSILFVSVLQAAAFGQAAPFNDTCVPRHHSLSQRVVGIFFNSNVIGTASSSQFAVRVNGTLVTVTGVASNENAGVFAASIVLPGTNVIAVQFDASNLLGGTHPTYLLPGDVPTITFVNSAAPNNVRTQGTNAVVANFGPLTSKNCFYPGFESIAIDADVKFSSEGNPTAIDLCSPVNTDFYRWTYSYSQRFRNSSKWAQADQRLNISWNGPPNTISNLAGYLSDDAGVPNTGFTDLSLGYPRIFLSYRSGANSVGVLSGTNPFTYNDNTGFCNFIATGSPSGVTAAATYNGSSLATLRISKRFDSYDFDDQNTGALILDPAPYPNAGTGTTTNDQVCFGTNVGMRFTDVSDFNCIGSGTQLTVPTQGAAATPINSQQRWIRFVYGAIDHPGQGNIRDIHVNGVRVTSATTGALEPAFIGNPLLTATLSPTTRGYVVTGAGAIGTPDAFGVIQLPANAVESNVLSSLITTLSTANHAVGQRFYVTIQYWNVCNPYPSAAPVETTVDYVEIIDKPNPPTVANRDICSTESRTLTVNPTVAGTTYRWYASMANALANTNVLVTATSYTPAPAAGTSTNYFVTATLGNGCVSTPTTVNLKRRSTLSSAGLSIVGPSNLCPASSYSFSVNNPPAAGAPAGEPTQYRWVVPAGWTVSPATGQNVTITTPAATGSGTITVNYEYVNNTSNNTKCGVTFSTSPTVRGRPTVNITPDPLNLCEGATPQLNGNPTLPFGSISTHTWGGDAAAILDATNIQQPSISASAAPGAFNLTYSVTADFGGSVFCTSANDNLTVNISAATAPANAGPNQDLCISPPLTATLAGSAPAPGTGTWTKVSGPGGVPAFSNANSRTSTVTVASPGVYVLRWTVVNGSCSTFDDVQIDFGTDPGPQNAGNDNVFCGLSGAMAATAPTVGTIAWSQVSGPPTGTTTFSNNTVTATATATVYGTYVYKMTVTSGQCAVQEDNVQIIYHESATANSGSNFTTCVDQAVLAAIPLSGTIGGGATAGSGGRWERVSGTGTMQSSGAAAGSTVNSLTVTDNYVPTLADFTAGSVQVRLVALDPDGPGVANPCGNVNGTTITITLDRRPTNVNADSDGNTANNITCTGTFALGAAAPTNGVGTWTGPGGVTFSNANSPTSNVNNLPLTAGAPTVTTLTWTVRSAQNVCAPIVTTVDVTRYPLPTANTITPQLCDATFGAPLQTTGVDLSTYSASVSNGTVRWYASAANRTAGINEIVAPVSVAHNQTFFFRANSGAPANCTNDGSTTFTVNALPATLDKTVEFCEDGVNAGIATGINLQSYEMGATGVTAGGTAVTRNVEWYEDDGSGGLGALIPPASETNYSIIETKTIHARVIDLGSAVVPQCSDIADLTLRFKPKPINNAITGSSVVCTGNSGIVYQLDPLVNNYGTDHRYTWTVTPGAGSPGPGPVDFQVLIGGGTNSINSFVFIRFPGPNTGSVVITAQEIIDGCAGNVASFNVTVAGAPPPLAFNSPATQACKGSTQSYTLTTANVGSTYNWTVTGGTIIGSSTTIGPNVTIAVVWGTSTLPQPNVTVTETSSSGCSGTPASVDVTLNDVPQMSSLPSATICSGQNPASVLPFTASGVTPNNVNFSWRITNVTSNVTFGGAAIPIFPAAGSTGAGNLTHTLTNTSGADGTIIYEVTPTEANPPSPPNCAGNPQTVTVTVRPEPVGTNATTNQCSNLALGFNLTTSGSSVAAANYTIAVNPNGLTQIAGTGSAGTSKFATELADDVWQNLGATSVDVVYTVTPFSAAGCAGANFTVTATINPKPTGAAQTTTVCSDALTGITLGTTGGSAPAATYNITVTPNGLTFSGTTASAGTGKLANELTDDRWTNTGLLPIDVDYMISPVTAAGCIGDPVLVRVTVNPEPVGSNSTATRCSDELVNLTLSTGGTSVAATAYDIAVNANGLTFSGTSASAGAGKLANELVDDRWTNTGLNPVDVIYTITPISASGCGGDAFSVTVTVRPEPVGANSAATRCSDELLSLSLTTSVTAVAAATYNIAISSGALVFSGTTASGGNGKLANELMDDRWTNTTTLPIDVTYTITPVSSQSCAGDPFTVTVTINPEPLGANATTTVCSDAVLGFALTTDVTAVAAANYTIAVNPNGLVQSAGSASAGTGKLANELADDVWRNTGLNPTNVVYTITPFSTIGCAGNSFTVTATIDPEPVGSNSATTLCGNAPVAVNLSTNPGSVAAATYDIAINPNGLTLAAGTPSGGTGKSSIEIADDVWANTGLGPVNVIYSITPVSAANCSGDAFTVTVTVNPQPVGSNITATRCSDAAVGLALTTSATSVAASSYNITTANGGLSQSAGTASAGNGKAANELVDDVWRNTGLNPVNVVYTVRPVSAAGCIGDPFTITVTVNPEPVGANSTATRCSDEVVGLTLTTSAASVSASTYNISVNANGLTLSAGIASAGTGKAATELADDVWRNTGLNPVNVVYTITPVSADLCEGDNFTVTVTVNPEPVGSNSTAAKCSDEVLGINLTTSASAVAAANFTIAVNANGLLQVAGTNSAGSSKAANELADDVWANTTNAPVDVVYTITPFSAAGCTGDDFTVTVTINPEPIGVAQTPTRCSDELVNVTLGVTGASVAAATYNIAVNANGLVFSGTTPSSGNGKAANELVDDKWTNTGLLPVAVTYTINPVSAANCVGDAFIVTVTVNPEPVGAAGTATRCSDEVINFALTTNGAAVAAATYDIATNANGLTQSAGTVSAGLGKPANELLDDAWTNTGLNPVNVVYTVTPISGAGCAGNPFTVTITVRPEPVGTPASVTKCSDELVNLTISTDLTAVAAATYDISVNANGLIFSGTSNSNGLGKLANELMDDKWTNTGLNPVNVIYTITPISSQLCSGNPFDITVTVRPEPVGANSTATVCSDVVLGVTLTTNAGAVAAANYTIAVNPNGLVQSAGTNSAGSNKLANELADDVWRNTGLTPVNVVYTITPFSAAGCAGNDFLVTVTVNPEPVGSNTATTICANIAVGLVLSTNPASVAAATYTIAVNPNGLTLASGTASAGAGKAANEIADDVWANTGLSTVSVIYTITPVSADMCSGDPFTVTVTVNPQPVGSNMAITRCSDTAVGAALTTSGTSVGASSFNILVANGGLTQSGGTASAGNGKAANELVDDIWRNTGLNPVNVVYTVTPVSASGCLGDPFTVTVTVDPEPVGANSTITKCSDEVLGVTLTTNAAAVAASTYTIAVNANGLTLSAGTASAGSGKASNELADDVWRNTGLNPVDVIYTITPVSASLCDGNQFTVTVTVNPEPVGSSTTASNCSDEVLGINLTTSATSVAAAAYNILVNNNGLPQVGGTNSAGPGKAATEIADDVWRNLTNAPVNVLYTITPLSGANCAGDDFTITVTINPEPVGVDQTPTRCSDELLAIALGVVPGSVAAATYNILINANGLTFSGTSASAGNGKLANELMDDKWTNTGLTPVNVEYTITPVSGALCAGNTFTVVVTVNPEPVGANSTATRCSDEALGVGLTLSTIGTAVPAATYDIVINANGLTFSGTSASNGTGKLANELTDDMWTNTGLIPINVIYTITPVSAAGCSGDPFTVNLTVRPEPVGFDSNVTVCSDQALGFTLSTNGSSVAAQTYNITVNSNGLVQSAGSASNGGGKDATELLADAWRNTGTVPVDVVYTITPVSAGPALCQGEPFIVTVTVNPEPVGADVTIDKCSDEVSGITLTTSGASVAADSYHITVNSNGLTQSAGVASAGLNMPANALADDAWHNITTAPVAVVYTITPVTAAPQSCQGNPFIITLTINPEPVGQNVLVTDCSTILSYNIQTANINALGNGLPSVFTYTVSSTDEINVPTPAGLDRVVASSADITDSYINTSSAAVDVTYTITPFNAAMPACGGTVFTYTVRISPKPVGVSNTKAAVCSDVGFDFDPQADLSPSVSSTFTWTVTYDGGIVPRVQKNPKTGNITETLTNTTLTVLNAVYEVIPTATGSSCVGDPFLITVPINPEPVMANAPEVVQCSDIIFGTDFVTNASAVAAANFDVAAVVESGLTGAPTTGTLLAATAIHNDIFTNLTAAQLRVTYTITPRAATGCLGDADDIIFKVNPEPVLASQVIPDVCSSNVNNPSVTNIVLGTNGTSINAQFYRLDVVEYKYVGDPTFGAAPAGFTPGPSNRPVGASSNANTVRNDSYNNLSDRGVIVKYTFTSISPAPASCIGDALDFEITINPQPTIDPLLSPTPVCSDVNTAVTLSVDPALPSVAAADYAYKGVSFPGLIAGPTNASTGVAQPASVIFNDTYTNTTAGTLPVDYTFAARSAAGCTGLDTHILLNINPAPNLLVAAGIACNDAQSQITLSGDPSAVAPNTYDLISVTVPAGLTPTVVAAPGTGVAANYLFGDRFVNTTTVVQKVQYFIKPVSAAACRGPQEIVEFTVEPPIVIVPNPSVQTICGDGLVATSVLLENTTTIPSAGPLSYRYTAVSSSAQVSGFNITASFLPNPHTIADMLVNNSNTAQTVTYNVTAVAAGADNGLGCSATSAVPVVITVEPKPKLTIPATKTVCEDVAVAVALNSPTVPTSGAASVFYDLITTPTGNVTNFSPTGTPFANGQTLNDVLVNGDPVNASVEYKFTPRFGTCVGAETTMVVTVAPRPVIDPIGPFDICSEVGVGPIGLTVDTETAQPGSTFINWTVVADPDVTGEAPGAGNSFTQVLFNNSANAKTLTYTLSARNVANVPACNGAPITVLVTVFPKPKLVGLPTSVNVCNNETKTITLSGSATGTQFDWLVDNNSNPDLPPIGGSGGPAINQTFINNGDALGSYLYTVTPKVVILSSGAECFGNPGNMLVNVAPSITGSLTVNGDDESFICKGSTQQLTFQFTGLALFDYTYTDGTTTKTVIKQPLFDNEPVAPLVTTDYTLLSVKDGFGCLHNPTGQTVRVNVGSTTAAFAIDGPNIACSPYQVKFKHDQVSGVNYTWRWNDGVADSTYLTTGDVAGQIVRHTFFNSAPKGNQGYDIFLEAALSEDFPNACRSTQKVKVTVYPTVAPAVFANKEVICSDENVAFTNSSQGADIERWFYRVLGTSTEIDPRTTKNVTYTLANTSTSNPIVYEVVYRSTNTAGCAAPDVITPITVYRGVDANFSNTTPTVFVGGHSTVTFTNTSAPVDGTDFRYEWDFGLDGNPATSQGTGPFNLDYTTPGPKEINLLATNIIAEAAGLTCADEFSKIIQIVVPPLIADFTAIPLEACFPTDITVTENKATGDKFSWRVLDNAGTAAQSNAELPVFKIPAPGKYTVELVTINSFTGDQKTATKDFIIYDLPMASFDIRPGVVYVPDTELSTYNFSDGATGYQWDFGDGTLSDEKEPTHKYRIEGVYDVTLIAMNDHGNNVVCVDTLTRKVTAKQGGVTRVPNAFTPNPNGPTSSAGTPGIPGSNSFNDVFLPQVKGAEEFNMQVFDRWGNLVFESNNSNVGWDGYDRHGKMMPAGVYVYKLTLRLSDGQRTTQVGDITMIR